MLITPRKSMTVSTNLRESHQEYLILSDPGKSEVEVIEIKKGKRPFLPGKDVRVCKNIA